MARARREASATLAGLLGALRAVTGWLGSARVKFAVVGGVAASLHGQPRVTQDVDLVAMADEDEWVALLAQGRGWGLRPRTKDAIAFARTTRVLLLVHQPTGIEVDLSFGMLPFERELVQRARPKTVRGVRFPLATAEDVMVMKALALRPRDVADIEGILESTRGLDLRRVRARTRELSALLETVDHVAELDRIVRRTRRR